MSAYLIINLLIIIFPLILSFDKKVGYYKNIGTVIFSILVVGLIYIVWDIIAVSRGDWSFNLDFVNGIYVLNLPLEEILFFITVPYSCIFIYEVIKSYFGKKKLIINYTLIKAVIIIFTGLAIYFSRQYYTFTVLLFSAVFLLLALTFYRSILHSKTYWLTILVSYIPFFIVNYLLTSLPVVEYNEKAIWGIRIITIPVEDFLYSYSLISLWLMVYLIIKNHLTRKTNPV